MPHTTSSSHELDPFGPLDKDQLNTTLPVTPLIKRSFYTKQLDEPPSCVEFCPSDQNYLVIGTYLLSEKREQGQEDAQQRSQHSSDSDATPAVQSRAGSILLVNIDPDTGSDDGSVRIYTIDRTTRQPIPGTAYLQLDPHTQEAWYAAFSPTANLLFTGGDDLAFNAHLLPPSKHWQDPEVQAIEAWSDTRTHGAGVTSILPLDHFFPTPTHFVLLTGSYDESIRLFTITTTPAPKKTLEAEHPLGGGVWRLKQLGHTWYDPPSPTIPGERRCTLVLASCMHAGVRVLSIEHGKHARTLRKVHPAHISAIIQRLLRLSCPLLLLLLLRHHSLRALGPLQIQQRPNVPADFAASAWKANYHHYTFCWADLLE
ncbi:MAG: hypothetical protein Q9227_001894 [Pyrenula ochraceoflavens]